MRKRILSLLLALTMTLSILPVGAIAAELEELWEEPEGANMPDDQRGILYSDARLTLSAEDCLAEDGGSYPVTLTRGGDAEEETHFAVVVYDNSTNYGEDYRILYDGEAVEKLEGSRSVYDAFRDEGELSDGVALDLAIAEALAGAEQNDDGKDSQAETVSAAAALAQLDELGAKAAAFTVSFAAGQRETVLTVEVLDDGITEYEETFLMAVLDKDGEAVESAQQIFAIEDDDGTPEVTVAFDCEDGLALTDDSDAVELQFRRSGDLATTTLVTLYLDGEAYGQVDFAPWQELQRVKAACAGVYTLEDGDEAVEVCDDRTATRSVAEGADPELDAVPDEYAVIRTPRTNELDNTAWLPGWATGRESTNETQTVYLGSAKDNNLFKAGGNSSKGSVTFFVDDLNVHEVSTSGDGTYTSTGELWADSIKSYDFTGVESVESTVYIDGVDHEANISIGVYQTANHEVNVTDDGTYTLTTTLPDKCQSTKYVYYHNEDPKGWCGGTNLFVPNGFKMNLRQYRFDIVDDADVIDPGTENGDGTMDYTSCALYYNGGTNPGRHVPRIDAGKDTQYMTINSKDYGKNRTVDICYSSTDGQYPAKLVGYRLMNGSTGAMSAVISLTDGSNGSGTGTASITFDTDFLKKYENDYCVYEDLNGAGAWTFHIVPVYEKVDTRGYVLSSDVGDLEVYPEASGYAIGDKWVFYGVPKNGSKAQLSGVWYQAFTNASDQPVRQGISTTTYGTDGNMILLDILYPRYTLQGVFSADSTRLLLYYADDAAKLNGVVENDLRRENEVVSPEQYVVGDYVSLVAKPNDGYITRWKVNGVSEYYYGNVFNYQLDGNPDHNIVYVDFVAKTEDGGRQTTGTLTGNLRQAYVEARLNGSTSWLPMANTTISITADQTYTVTTDADGNFTIENFEGVSNGIYSMSVLYDEAIGYTTFNYTPGSSMNIQMPQFATGVPYPYNATADVDGAGSNQNMLTLTSGGTLNVSVRVYTPPKNYAITGVNFYFLNSTLVAGGAGTSAARAYSASYQSTDGDCQIWNIKITDTSELQSGTRLYVEVVADKEIYHNDSSGDYLTMTTSISTGLVDCGYGLTTANDEDIYSVSYDVPQSPSMQQALDVTSIEVPVLGALDFSLTSKTGGFFSQRSDSQGNTVLICGSTYLNYFGTGTVSQKLEDKRKTSAALSEAERVGAANADVTAVGNRNVAKVDAPSKWTFAPAYLFKFTLSKTTDGSSTYVSRYEMALGVDASYIRNIPFSVYGVPFYVCLMFTGEAYFDIQAEFAEAGGLTMDGVSEDLLFGDRVTRLDTYIVAPVMSIMAKGGVGYNGFLSLYLSAGVTCPFIIDLQPGGDVEAAANFGFNVAAGADLVLFSGSISKSLEVSGVGDAEQLAKLKTITQEAAADVSPQFLRSAMRSVELEELLNETTFAPMVRSALRRSAAESGTVAANVFKNTGVHLLKLDEDSLLAFYLKDNGNGDENSLNYLTVAYSVSTDGGESWGEMAYVSDNTRQPNTSLQFDVNLFDLGDCTLVTWSEANFDQVLSNLDEVDIDRLTLAQISRFMNAMDLRGRIFDENGNPMGEAFTIAENSTVACGALDAVKNGDMIYVYYQRNVYPSDESDGEITLTDLLSTERTIAMARADVNDTDEWISTPVRAEKANGQQYRITDVEPFVHDGVMGEILVLDRDGRLAEWNSDTEAWDASNEDRQLYLRTYTFDEETGKPIPSALLAITDPGVCAQNPQVVSNDDYLHLLWNQDGQIVYLTDFVATSEDSEAVRKGAYVVVDEDGNATVNADNKGKYYANGIAADDEHFHIGTTFSASMDNDGHVLLSWVATDTASDALTDEVYGVVLETVTNAQAVEASNAEAADRTGKGSGLAGSDAICQLLAKGSPVALTEDTDGLIGALDSVFVSDGDNGSFLLAFSRLNDALQEEATSADILARQSVYESQLEITRVSAPEYPMPGSEMTLSVTVANRGLGEATGVEVCAEGVGDGANVTIDSILPGRSKTVELTVKVPEDFASDAALTVTAADTDGSDSENVEVSYGPCFQIKQMPAMSNLAGSSDYRTETIVYNAGNAAGIPTLNYEVSIFACEDEGDKYSCTADGVLAPGGSAVLTCVLEDTPVTADDTGTLSVQVETGDRALGLYQCIQGQMPGLTAVVTMSDLKPGDEDDSDHKPIAPVAPTVPSGDETQKPSEGETSGSETQESTAPVFDDVVSGIWYEKAVSWAVENDITTGTGESTFGPELSCTRAEAVTFLWRAAGCPTAGSGTMTMSDVPADAWYREAVLWAVENGITTGTGNGLFSPDMVCTRAQIATMIYRMEQTKGGGFTGAWAMKLPFTDVPDWAFEAVAWCYMKGITTGIGETTFGPDLICSRAQIVTLLYRYSTL